MPCECRTTARTLAVLARSWDEVPELLTFARERGWPVHDDLGLVLLSLGAGGAWPSVGEAAAFLRGILDAPRYTALRAAWVDADVPLERQLPRLIHAEPLAEIAALDSSPLLAVLDEGRLETWFQPIFWAGTLAPWGYECLARGRAEDGSVIGAGTLLGWARQERLVFLFDRVCRELHLRNAGTARVPDGARFLVNFLPTAVYRPEFCLRTTVAVAAEARLDPDRVIFELVETERVADRPHLKRLLDFYRAAGFGVALDDLGSGYSGLSLLADLSPDLIKLDRELVSRAVDSAFHRGVCASLVRLGQENGQLVLAEGIETEDEWAVMRELGVNLLQGFLFGPPAPVPAVTALVAGGAPTPAA